MPSNAAPLIPKMKPGEVFLLDLPAVFSCSTCEYRMPFSQRPNNFSQNRVDLQSERLLLLRSFAALVGRFRRNGRPPVPHQFC